MHRLAFVNQKGGCGKTTTAVNLAGALAREGKRVLVCDLDPQAHATLALGCAVEEGDPSMARVLLHGESLGSAVHAAPGGVGIVPSSLELAEFESAAERVLHPESFLRNALGDVEDVYDFALFDCPPRADGVLTANALRAADTAVLVVETGAFALQGAFRAIGILEEVASSMETEFDLRVLATLYDRRQRLARELLIGTHARFGDRMFDTVVHESIRLREAAAFGVPVHVLDPECRAARDFAALADEVTDLREGTAAAVLEPAATHPTLAESEEGLPELVLACPPEPGAAEEPLPREALLPRATIDPGPDPWMA